MLLRRTKCFEHPGDKKEGDVDAQKQLQVQIIKDREKARQDFARVQLRVDNTFDIFLDTVQRNKQLTGADPGTLSGLLINILAPAQVNEFRDAFKGSLIQMAAASARISMPGTRAIRAVNVFKKTTLSEFQSVESAIQTSTFDFRNALANEMSVKL